MKLTAKQQQFLDSLDSAEWCECEAHERRTAESLQSKGLVEISDGNGYFECRLSQSMLLKRIKAIDLNDLDEKTLRKVFAVLNGEHE